MSVKDIIRQLSAWLDHPDRVRANRDDLVCGDCPRMTSCGLAPSDTCLEKLQYRALHEFTPRPRHSMYTDLTLR